MARSLRSLSGSGLTAAPTPRSILASPVKARRCHHPSRQCQPSSACDPVPNHAERDHLLRPAAEGFELAEVTFPLVDKQGCVTVKTNAYSVPARAGSRLEARVYPLQVELWHGGRRIARHERCHGRRQQVLDLEHYLDVLGHKPGALAGSKPLEQCRRAGRWPACYDE